MARTVQVSGNPVPAMASEDQREGESRTAHSAPSTPDNAQHESQQRQATRAFAAVSSFFGSLKQECFFVLGQIVITVLRHLIQNGIHPSQTVLLFLIEVSITFDSR